MNDKYDDLNRDSISRDDMPTSYNDREENYE